MNTTPHRPRRSPRVLPAHALRAIRGGVVQYQEKDPYLYGDGRPEGGGAGSSTTEYVVITTPRFRWP
jgi:hypothetical protein